MADPGGSGSRRQERSASEAAAEKREVSGKVDASPAVPSAARASRGRTGRRTRAGPPIRPVVGRHGRFDRAARLLKRWEFQRVQREGIRIRTSAFTIVARRSLVGRPRLGMAVSRKVGGAVVRNRIKRCLRELFRRTAPSLPPVDLVVIALPAASELAVLSAVEAAVVPAWGKACERALQDRRGR